MLFQKKKCWQLEFGKREQVFRILFFWVCWVFCGWVLLRGTYLVKTVTLDQHLLEILFQLHVVLHGIPDAQVFL